MVDLRGLFGSQIDKDYFNLSGDAFAKKYPEKAKEIQENIFVNNTIYRLADKNLLADQAFDEWLDQLGDW